MQSAPAVNNTVDKAEVGQVATYSTGGRVACCACAQPAGCTATPSCTSFNVSRNDQAEKHHFSEFEMNIYIFGENEYHFHIK